MVKRKAVKNWKFPSESDPAKAYKTTLWDDGTFSCNCPSWVFWRDKSKPRGCLHVNGVKVSEAVGSGQRSVAVTVNIPLPMVWESGGRRRIVLED